MTLVKSNGNKYGLTRPSMFDDFFGRDIWNWDNNMLTGTTLPSVNIQENSDNFFVEMAAPGMKKDDFKVELDGNLLTITSEKKTASSDEEYSRYSRKEFSYESFTRSFQLPKEVVDEESIKAKYTDGVLQLTIPKKETAKQRPPKTINIE